MTTRGAAVVPGAEPEPYSHQQADREAAERSAARLRLKGIGLMCAALVCFSCLDAIAKWLGQQMDPLQVVWARYCGALVVVLILFNPWRHPEVLVTRRPWVQAVRSAILFASTALNFLALQYLQLDQTISIIFATPFIVAVLSGPLLGEWIGPRRWAAVVAGFAGVLVVTQPWSGAIHWAMVLSMIGAVCYALYNLMTRMLAGHDSAGTTSIYSVAFGAVVATALVPMAWSTPQGLVTVLAMAAVGVFGAVGHWLLILAHGYAPAGVLAPFIYSQIIWMTGLGWLIFAQVPAANTLAGAAIVIASGLYLLYRERVVAAGKA